MKPHPLDARHQALVLSLPTRPSVSQAVFHSRNQRFRQFLHQQDLAGAQQLGLWLVIGGRHVLSAADRRRCALWLLREPQPCWASMGDLVPLELATDGLWAGPLPGLPKASTAEEQSHLALFLQALAIAAITDRLALLKGLA